MPQSRGARTFDLGDGFVAALEGNGFTLARNGQTLVSSAQLFARTLDPDAPDGWHDPTKAHDDLATAPIDLSTVDATPGLDAAASGALHLVVPAQPDDTALVSLSFDTDDAFLTGLGERFDHVSAIGRVSPMYIDLGGPWESGTNETHVPVPLLVSPRGWGVFVASREAGAFDVGATAPGTVSATFEGRSLDAWFFVDPDPLAVVARFARMTGLARPLPRWALSPIHWAHWASESDVVAIATEYRTRHIPTSCLWFDDGWQTGFNTFVIAPKVFADPAGTMTQLAALGYRVLAWTTPYLEKPGSGAPDDAQKLFTQAQGAGLFVKDGEGRTFVSPATPIKGGAGIVDFTAGDARAFWETLVSNATGAGIHGFKCDYGEEIVPHLFGARLDVRFADGSDARTGRLFPIAEHATYHAALDAAFPRDGILIVRASSYGGAAQADVVWPGDLDSGFQRQGDALPGGSRAVGGLPAVVVAAQTLAASGFPAFGSDTAGYRGEPTRESLLRWIEHTALSVVMQVYEDGDARKAWKYDDAAAAEYQAMAALHQRLEPYTATLMRDASTVGTPTIRALPLAFPGDAAGFARADDEYMLGPALLVAPVIDVGATTKSVHLPPGKWVHWWSDRAYDGAQDVTVEAPLGSPPLFARAGSIVPMLPQGIDTLVDATAPGVVTRASRAGETEARAWAMGAASVLLDDASSIAVDDGAQGVGVTWAPGAQATQLTIDVDVRARTGASAAVSAVDTLSGAALAQVADESAVRASKGGAWAVDAQRAHVWMRLVGAGSARAR